jgi:hypothetical protein
MSSEADERSEAEIGSERRSKVREFMDRESALSQAFVKLIDPGDKDRSLRHFYMQNCEGVAVDLAGGVPTRETFLRTLEREKGRMEEVVGSDLTLAHVFAVVDATIETCFSDVRARPGDFATAMAATLAFDGLLNHFPRYNIRTGTDTFLGLRRLRGPVQFINIALYKTSNIVLLGDHHAGNICTLPCTDAQCVSAQPIKDKRSGPLRGVDTTFLEHLNTVYGHLRPDVYLETWMTDEVRSREDEDDPQPELSTMSPADVFNYGPLQATEQYLRPCMVPATRATAACAYHNIRVHASDPRMWDRRVWSPLYKLGEAVASNSTRQVLEFLCWCKKRHPDFGVEDILRAVFDVHPLASLTHAFCRRTSRVHHEVRQLGAFMAGRLMGATEHVTPMRPLPYDLATPILSWLRQVLHMARVPVAVAQLDVKLADVALALKAWPASGADDMVLHPLVQADLSMFVQNRMYTARGQADTNMYTLARILKQRASQLHVVMMGFAHTELIARTVDCMGVGHVIAAGKSFSKCLEFSYSEPDHFPKVSKWRLAHTDSEGEGEGEGDNEGSAEEGFTDLYKNDQGPELQGFILPQAPFGIYKSHLRAWDPVPFPTVDMLGR